MSHEIAGKHFYSNRERPWHGIGQWGEDKKLTAVAGRQQFAPLDATIHEMFYEHGGVMVPAPNKAIVAHPIPGTPGFEAHRHIATVSKDYHIIEPQRVAEIIDDEVGMTLATVGLLNDATVFYSFEHDGVCIGGDEITRNTLIVAPINGMDSYAAVPTNTRVVCQNTLNFALSDAENSGLIFDAQHTRYAEEDFRSSIQTAMGAAGKIHKLAEEAFSRMVAKPINANEVGDFFAHIFQPPSEPKPHHIARIDEGRKERFVKASERALAYQVAAENVWNGNGYEHVVCNYAAPARETVWGVYNAATEVVESGGSNTKNKAGAALFSKATRRATEQVFSRSMQWVEGI